MTHSDHAIYEGLIELVKEGEKTAEADEQLKTALGRFEIASRRYAAVRDTVTDMLGGESPFEVFEVPDRLHEMKEIPADPSNPNQKYYENPHFRMYRYLHKSVGEAVLNALRYTPFPLTLSQLVEDLKEGHLSTDARAVNASLLNMNGVEKLPDGSYQIESSPSIVNTDDLPF